MSAITKILDILERFEAQKITAIRSNGRETAYEWSGKSGQKYRAWLTSNASRSEPNKHYVSVAFGTVHHDANGNEVERVDSHDLPDDPTDTIETVHRITDHYLQKKVAKAHPDATHVVVSNDPVKSEKDKKSGKQSPEDTQRGSLYRRLLHRALRNNPRNAGVSSAVVSDSTGQHMHLGFPGGIAQHYATDGRSTLAHQAAVPESFASVVSPSATGAPPTMSRKGVAANEAATRPSKLVGRTVVR